MGEQTTAVRAARMRAIDSITPVLKTAATAGPGLVRLGPVMCGHSRTLPEAQTSRSGRLAQVEKAICKQVISSARHDS